MHGHRCVAITGRGTAAEALVEILSAEVVEEESVGGLELAVVEEHAYTRPRLETVHSDLGAGQPLGTAVGAVTTEATRASFRDRQNAVALGQRTGAALAGTINEPGLLRRSAHAARTKREHSVAAFG
jgi:hypothetical protein